MEPRGLQTRLPRMRANPPRGPDDGVSTKNARVWKDSPDEKVWLVRTHMGVSSDPGTPRLVAPRLITFQHPPSDDLPVKELKSTRLRDAGGGDVGRAVDANCWMRPGEKLETELTRPSAGRPAMVQIRWSIDPKGRGKIELVADRGDDEGKLEAVQRFDSLDELPPPWARAIREDGRPKGEATVH